MPPLPNSGISFTLSPPKGITYWLLLIIGTALLIISFWAWSNFSISGKSTSSRIYLHILIYSFTFSSLAYFFAWSRPVYQILPSLTIRRRQKILGIKIPITSTPILLVSQVKLDASHTIIHCYNAAGAPILAIEEFNTPTQANQCLEILQSLCQHQSQASKALIDSLPINKPTFSSHALWITITFVTLLAAFICSLFSKSPKITTPLALLVTITISIGSYLYAFIDNSRITSKDRQLGTLNGWIRHRYLWKTHFQRNLKSNTLTQLHREIDKQALTHIVIIALISTISLFSMIKLNSLKPPSTKHLDTPKTKNHAISEEDRLNAKKGVDILNNLRQKQQQSKTTPPPEP